MVSRVLSRKLRRDLWRQRWQFLAAALVIAIGVSVFVAASDAYRNLQQSFDRAYASQLLPDAVLSGPGATDLGPKARSLPGNPIVDVRRQGDLGTRIHGHTLLGRAVGVPVEEQPAVSQLALRSGALPGPGELVVEQHLADHYGLRPGDKVELLGAHGWRTLRVSGSALSAEYFWPARSMQEVMTTPEHFGVVFVTESDLSALVPRPVEQLLVYARDRDATSALAGSAATLAADEGLVYSSREDQPSYTSLKEDVDAFGTFADLLPWVFLVAGVLGTYVLLSRLVVSQRAVVGTLSANGLSGRTLRRHYLGYGVVAGLGGSAVGLVGGYFLGGWFTTMYTDALGLSLHVTSVHPVSLVIGAAGGTAAAALAAWGPARAAAHTSPAEAMRIAPPGVRGGRSTMERIIPPLRRLPARWRMTLRGVMRNRRRTVLTVLGVAVSVTIVMVFAGLRDTVSNVIDRQYDTIQREDAEVAVASGALDAVLAGVRADPGVAAAEPLARYDATLTTPGQEYRTLLVAMSPDTRMHRFITDDETRRLPAEGVLLGRGIESTLGLEVGDPVVITMTQSGRHLEETVAGFVDEPMNPVAYISLDQLSRVSGAPAATGVLLQLDRGATDREVAARVAAMPGVAAYLSTATVESAMREAFSLYDVLVGLMLAFAALMAAALLYNAMSANVAERSVELGTLQAAGMGSGMLGRLVATENLMLVVVGLPLGLGLGTLLADWFMSTFETQGYVWSLDMATTTPALVAAGVFLAALVAQVPALRAVRHTDLARIVRERSL